MKYNLPAFVVLLCLCNSITAQTVFLKWKLKPNETLVYKTVLEDADTGSFKFNMDRLNNLLIDSSGFNSKKDDYNKVLNDMKDLMGKAKITTSLKEKRPGIIGIEMEADYDKKDESPLFSLMDTKVMLRGEISTEGDITSFYYKNDQRNLISILFQLPGKAIQQGDKWPLELHLISVDQNFICDTSYHKNIVQFTGIKTVKGDSIAVLKYDVEEFISGNFNSPLFGKPSQTTMLATFKGIAEFNINKGRWASYNGFMGITSTGLMDSNVLKKVSLIEK